MFLRIKNLSNEKWEPVKFSRKGTTKNKYFISNHGRIVSNNGVQDRLCQNHKSAEFPYLKVFFYEKSSPEMRKKLDAFSEKIRKYVIEIAKTKRKIKLNNNKSQKDTLKKTLAAFEEKLKIASNKRVLIVKEDLKMRRARHAESIAKLVARNFVSAPPSSKHIFVLHKDFNPHNNYYKNLQWGTQKDLTEHSHKSPRVKKARLHRIKNAIYNNTKLTERNVVEIKKLLEKGKTLKFIATKFSVSDMQISRIKSGENWKRITID